MEKENITQYGLSIIIIVILMILIPFANIFGRYIGSSNDSIREGYQSKSKQIIQEAETAFDNFSLNSSNQDNLDDLDTLIKEESEETVNG